jgi:hypothetical protein
MLALETGEVETAKQLIAKRADFEKAAGDGQTAATIAQKKEYAEIFQLMDAPAGPGASAGLPEVVRQLIPVFPGARIVSADACIPAPQTVCNVTLEMNASKTKAYDFYRKQMERSGWAYDTDLHADDEQGALNNSQVWGMTNFTFNSSERVTSATLLIPSEAKTGSSATQLLLVYQSHLRYWNPVGNLTYSQVAATYPEGVTRCSTVVQLIGVSADGKWTTSGIVQYRNHVPQLRCYGTRVELKIPVIFGGVQCAAGTKLTVDKDLNWIPVSSWD